MSVRVNLLPQDVRARGQANRARILAGVAGVVLLLVLAGLTFLQRQSLSDAESRLATVEERNAQLQADITALQPFAELEARAAASVDVVTLALGDQKSFATVLQDLSAVLPPNADLQSLAITFDDEAVSPSPGGDRLIFGRMSATGRVLDGHAPGVERLAIDLARVAAFDNVFVTTSSVDEEGVATFSIEVELGPEVFTNRFAVVEEAAPPPADAETEQEVEQ